MAYKIEFHPEAEFEFDEALAWYNERRQGLEQEFYQEYLAAEMRIEANPYQFPIVFGNTRRVNLYRFPYSVFFEIKQDSVFVTAIFHQKRNPGEWRGRV